MNIHTGQFGSQEGDSSLQGLCTRSRIGTRISHRAKRAAAVTNARSKERSGNGIGPPASRNFVKVSEHQSQGQVYHYLSIFRVISVTPGGSKTSRARIKMNQFLKAIRVRRGQCCHAPKNSSGNRRGIQCGGLVPGRPPHRSQVVSHSHLAPET